MLRTYDDAVRILSSELALRLLLALEPGRPLSLMQLARAVGARLSSVQVALRILTADHLIVADGAGKSRRYRLAHGEAVTHVLGLARSILSVHERLEIVARADPTVEFMARLGDELVVVFAPTSSALEQAAAARALGAVCERGAPRPRYLYHDDVRRELLADPGLRSRIAGSEILHGDLDRTFPDRSHHGKRTGRALGTANSAVRLPPGRLLRKLAKDHGLESMRLFGSATRSDFRPDSDLDIAIRYRPGVQPSLRSLRELEHELERASGRDVDLLDEDSLEPDIRTAVRKQAVSLL